ncbi:probable disease resistance protein At4g27220 [Citrus sinensis]|nr:probable disease resistance protein At4g27220 [Citrus sinensis]
MATEILGGALSKIGEYLVEATIHQVCYLFRFKSNVESLMNEDKNLRLALDRVQLQVNRAKRNAEDIEKDVQKWLDEVSDIITAVQKLGGEIQAKKTCLSGLCPDLGWRYRLSREVEKMTGKLLNLVNRGKFDRVGHIPPGIELFPSKDFVQFESTKSTFDQIIEAMKDDKINMVGIYGMGGVGKTTVAKEVPKKVLELGIFKEVVFAAVSQNPNVRNIQGQIAESLGLKLDEESDARRATRLMKRLRDEKQILIILDDVWARLDLNMIGVPLGGGCRILVTTRRKQVCHSMECESQIPLNALVEEEGLALFKRNACVGDELPTLNDLAKEVARECKGLPLAIVTIGSALKGKPIDEWNVVLKKMKNAKFVDVEDVDADIYALLKLSYDYLKGEETKLCFLLCSLYPEDYEIPLGDLVIYGKGLGLFEDANTIEEARSQLRVTINHLKASCLLLDGGNEELVKMHDIVRDVALWIASKEKKFFSKAGLGLKQWPKDEGLEQYAGISLMANELEVLPVSLAYPKLEILFFDCNYRAEVEVSDQFFVEMKALKVVHLGCGVMSVKSLQFLTNLRSLCLDDCRLKDIFSIGTLSRLEIFILRSFFDELAKELGELGELRLLDLRDCRWLRRIPANVIRSLSQLEELYIGEVSFRTWNVEGTGAETSNASLYELNSLSHLTMLSLSIEDKCIPKDFTFPKLIRYHISVLPSDSRGFDSSYFSETGSHGHIEIRGSRLTSFNAFKEVCHTLQTLEVSDCNALTCLFTVSLARSLVQLEILSVENCSSMKHIVVADNNMPVREGSHIVLPKLTNLALSELPNFMGFYEGSDYSTWPSLQELTIYECRNTSPSFTVFEAAGKDSKFLEVNNIARMRHGLKNLKLLEIGGCLTQVVFQLEGFEFDGGEGEHFLSFPSLETLRFSDLPELECIWKGPSQFINPQNLSILSVENCPKLRRIFSTTLARHLSKLEVLSIEWCSALEQIIVQDDEEEEQHQQAACFSNLLEITIYDCDNLKSLFHVNVARDLQQLKKLDIARCEKLEQIIFQDDEEEEQHQQAACFSNLLEISIVGCHNLKSLFHVNVARDLQQLKELSIDDCEKLEQIFVGDNAVEECKEIVLPGVWLLNLLNLPKLVHLCPVGCHLILPSLTHLWVTICPRIAARFSVDQNGSLHVKSEARQIDETNFAMEIDCSSTDQIRQLTSR